MADLTHFVKPDGRVGCVEARTVFLSFYQEFSAPAGIEV
jgi:hypothetical protein